MMKRKMLCVTHNIQVSKNDQFCIQNEALCGRFDWVQSQAWSWWQKVRSVKYLDLNHDSPLEKMTIFPLKSWSLRQGKYGAHNLPDEVCITIEKSLHYKRKNFALKTKNFVLTVMNSAGLFWKIPSPPRWSSFCIKNDAFRIENDSFFNKKNDALCIKTDELWILDPQDDGLLGNAD